MIERKFLKEKMNDYLIQQYLLEKLDSSSYSHATIQKIPLGEKITIYSSKPGLIVGRGGSNVKAIIETLKKRFGLQSPQVEIQEVSEPDLDPMIVAERVRDMLKRMGVGRFKFIGHNVVQRVMNAGAIGVEVQISGKVPSKRAKTWKFRQGYLPKTGYPADEYVKKGVRVAELKTGVVGITVKILPPNVEMPDKIVILSNEVEESVSEPNDVKEVPIEDGNNKNE